MKDGKPENLREARALRAAFVAGASWAQTGYTDKPFDVRLSHGLEPVDMAETLFPAPTETVYNTCEDPENRGWYWRVRDGRLEVNYIHEDFDNCWEPYDLDATPGLKPTLARLDVWRELFRNPSRQEPIE